MGLSADSFLILVQARPNTFSDEELQNSSSRIIGWYDFAGEECRLLRALSLKTFFSECNSFDGLTFFHKVWLESYSPKQDILETLGAP